MKFLMAIVGSLLLLLLSAFCLFGFLATFEPTDNALAFRTGYVVVGIGCLIAFGFLIRNASLK